MTEGPDADLGGDPACWVGLVADHRDREPPAGAPVPLPDLADATQVHHLVVAFYREVVFDEVLEPVFGEVAEVDWAEHIPKLIDYWCWILFGTGGPTGAVTGAHAHLHGLRPIEPVHCDRWFALWTASVDGRWRGPRAEHAKTHAGTLMAGLARHVFGFTWTPSAATLHVP